MPRESSKRYSLRGRSLARHRLLGATLALPRPCLRNLGWGSPLPIAVRLDRFRWFSSTSLISDLLTRSRPSLELSARLHRDSPSLPATSTRIRSAFQPPLTPTFCPRLSRAFRWLAEGWPSTVTGTGACRRRDRRLAQQRPTRS